MPFLSTVQVLALAASSWSKGLLKMLYFFRAWGFCRFVSFLCCQEYREMKMSFQFIGPSDYLSVDLTVDWNENSEQQSLTGFSWEDAYQPFSETYADVDRSTAYTDFSDAPDVPTPKMPFPMSALSFKDFETCVRRARNGSAPGPNGIPYTVWKCGPSLQHRLYTIVRKVWQAEIPTSWCQANIVLFHKREKY